MPYPNYQYVCAHYFHKNKAIIDLIKFVSCLYTLS
jgi:hypothetical protein